MATGGDLGAEVLGVGLVEERPDDRGRLPGPATGEIDQLLGWEQVFRQEPAEPVVVNLADECLHGGTVTRPAGGHQGDSTFPPAPPRDPGPGRPPGMPREVKKDPPCLVGSKPDKSRYVGLERLDRLSDPIAGQLV